MDLDEDYGDEHEEEKEREYEEERGEIDWDKFEWEDYRANRHFEEEEEAVADFLKGKYSKKKDGGGGGDGGSEFKHERSMDLEKDRDVDDAITRALSMPTVMEPYFWSYTERRDALVWASVWFKENFVEPFALTNIELITALGPDEGVYRVEVWDERRACGAWRDDVLLQATLRQCVALRIMAGMELPAFERAVTGTAEYNLPGATKFHEEKKAARKAFYERVQRPDLPFWIDPARAFELSVLNGTLADGYPATKEACMKARSYVKGLFDALSLAPDAITMICCTHKVEMGLPDSDVYVCCYKVFNAAMGATAWCTDGVLAFTRIQLVAALAVCGLAKPDRTEFGGFGALYEDSRRIREHVWKERTANSLRSEGRR